MKIYLIIISLFLTQNAAAKLKVTPIKKFPLKYGIHKPKGASHCKGTVGEISKIDIPNFYQKLKRQGFNCIAGDFDRNGIRDYAILTKGWQDDNTALGESDVYLLLIGSDGKVDVRKMPRSVNIFNFEFESDIELDENRKKTIGLIENGEGGDSTIFYFDSGGYLLSKIISGGK